MQARCILSKDYLKSGLFAPSQWEMALLGNDVSHWLGASLESALLSAKSLWKNYANLMSTLPLMAFAEISRPVADIYH